MDSLTESLEVQLESLAVWGQALEELPSLNCKLSKAFSCVRSGQAHVLKAPWT